jgi:hypothetical protein
MQLFSDYQGTTTNQQITDDEAAIQLDAGREAVLEVEPTPKSTATDYFVCPVSNDQPQEADDREFNESILFNQSCDSDSFCTVASLPLLPEDIQTYPVTDLIAYIAACKAIIKLFKGVNFKKYSLLFAK